MILEPCDADFEKIITEWDNTKICLEEWPRKCAWDTVWVTARNERTDEKTSISTTYLLRCTQCKQSLGFWLMLSETSLESQIFDIEDMRPGGPFTTTIYVGTESTIFCRLNGPLGKTVWSTFWLGVAYPGGLPHKKDGNRDARQKIWIKTLNETTLSVARALIEL